MICTQCFDRAIADIMSSMENHVTFLGSICNILDKHKFYLGKIKTVYDVFKFPASLIADLETLLKAYDINTLCEVLMDTDGFLKKFCLRLHIMIC